MSWWKKVAGAALVVSLVAGSGLTVMAATEPDAKQEHKASPEREGLRKLAVQIKATHEKIVGERERLV